MDATVKVPGLAEWQEFLINDDATDLDRDDMEQVLTWLHGLNLDGASCVESSAIDGDITYYTFIYDVPSPRLEWAGKRAARKLAKLLGVST